MRCCSRIAAAASLVHLLVLSAHAGAEVLWERTLREYIGHHWTGELIRHSVSTGKPVPEACHLTVTNTVGQSRAVACQIRDRRSGDGPNRYTCDLFCVLDLVPYEALTLRLMAGNAPPEVGSELPVASGEGHLTISSRCLEVRVPGPIPDGTSVSDAAIPSPLLGMRNTQQPGWVGRGSFSGTGPLVSLETSIVARGPVFVDAAMNYRFAKGQYSVALRVIRDQPVVLWRETFQNEGQEATLAWECSAGMPLRSAVWDYAVWSAFKGRVLGGGLGASKAFPLEFDSPPATIVFEPWVHWATPDVTTWLELWTVLPAIGKVSYEKAPEGRGPGLTEPAGTRQDGDLVAGGDDLEALETRDKPKGKEWALGIFMGNPLDWNPRNHGAYRGSMPRLELTREQQVFLKLPLASGQRTFGLSLAERTPNERVGQHNFVSGVVDTEARQIRYGETPLDEVKEYVLDYPGDPKESFPHLMTTEPDRLRYASALSPEMPFHGRIQGALGNFQRMAKTEGVKQAAASLSWDLAGTPDISPSEDVIRAALAAQDDSLAPLLQVHALAASRRFAIHFLRHGTGPGMGIAPHNWLSEEYGFGTIDLASRHLTPEQFQRVRARMLFAAYKFASENYWSPRLGFGGTPNMTTLVHGALGTIAMLYPNHPRSPEWRKAVEREIEYELTHWMCAKGGWLEAPHYMTVSIDPIFGFACGMANAGRPEMLYGEPLKKTMLWLAKITTPRDPRFRNRRHFPEIGHTYVMETTVLLTLMAKAQRPRDPAYADALQWTWYEMGGPTWPGIGGAYPLTAGYREALADLQPRPEKAPDWKSEWFPGTGVILRGHFPHERENYLYLIQGPMHSHYDNDYGSFVYWGKGRPLCLDFGYRGASPAWQHSRMEIGGQGKIAEFAALDRADYVHNEQAGWHRQVLFVKDESPLGPNYTLIRDTTSGEGSANWWLWVNTEDHPRVNGPLVSATGRDDVDLDLWFDSRSGGQLKRIRKPNDSGTPVAPSETDKHAAPDKEDEEVVSALTEKDDPRPVVIETTELTIPCVIGDGGRFWGKDGTTQRGIRIAVPLGQPVVSLLYPRLREEAVPEVTSFCGDRAMKVRCPAGTDYAFLAEQPFDAEVDHVRFKGKAGLVQIRGQRVTLTLAAAGEITVGTASLQSEVSATRSTEMRPLDAPSGKSPDGVHRPQPK